MRFDLLGRRIRPKAWRDDFSSLCARNHRDDFEGNPHPTPIQHPFLYQPKVIAFHELKAPTEVGLDPAVDVFEATWQ
jgi:hypothetical protein